METLRGGAESEVYDVGDPFKKDRGVPPHPPSWTVHGGRVFPSSAFPAIDLPIITCCLATDPKARGPPSRGPKSPNCEPKETFLFGSEVTQGFWSRKGKLTHTEDGVCVSFKRWGLMEGLEVVGNMPLKGCLRPWCLSSCFCLASWPWSEWFYSMTYYLTPAPSAREPYQSRDQVKCFLFGSQLSRILEIFVYFFLFCLLSQGRNLDPCAS